MSDSIAVVPIFVNAGAAILPVVMGAAASVISLLLRPRHLLRACRRHPITTCLLILGVTAAWWGTRWALSRSPGVRAEPAKAPKTDWPQVALDILRREETGALVPVPASGPYKPPVSAIVLGRDFSRRACDGSAAPLGLKLLWRHKGDDCMFLSSPAVSAGRVYAGSCLVDVTGNYGAVVCLDAHSGKVIWQTSGVGEQPFKGLFSSPAMTRDGKYLVVGQGLHDDRDCSLICLEAESGKVRWQVQTPLHIESSPAIHGDMAVAGAGAIEGPDRIPTSHGGFVLAVRISDGAELWRYDLADPESSPAIGEDGIVYIGSGFNGCAVVALRSQGDAELRERGLERLVWRASCPYPVTGAVTLAGERVLVGAGNGDYVYGDPNPAGVVLALDRRSGKVLWQSRMSDAVLGHVAVASGLAICPVRDGQVVALDLSDGRPIWSRQVSGKAPVLAGCALAGSAVYAVSRDGYLAVLDARSGKVLERYSLNDEARPGQMGLCLSSPTVWMGRLFVGSETGGLQCWAGTRVQP